MTNKTLRSLFIGIAGALTLSGCALTDIGENQKDLVVSNEDNGIASVIVTKNPNGGSAIVVTDEAGISSMCVTTPPGSNIRSAESAEAGGGISIDTGINNSGNANGSASADNQVSIDYNYSTEVAIATIHRIADCQEQFNLAQLCKYAISQKADKDVIEHVCPTQQPRIINKALQSVIR